MPSAERTTDRAFFVLMRSPSPSLEWPNPTSRTVMTTDHSATPFNSSSLAGLEGGWPKTRGVDKIAAAVINTVNGSEFSIDELVQKNFVEYIPFPRQLVGKYQSFTQADLSRLREAGYPGEFQPVVEGVADYVRELMKS